MSGPPIPGRFEDRTVLVTGAARGLGLATAERFAAEGARVMVADLDGEGAEAAAAKLGGDARGIEVDVTDPDSVAAMVAAATEWSGRLDHAVNNAGVVTMARLVDMTDAEFDRVMDVNAKGVFLCLRAELAAMNGIGGASIVNLASQAGKKGYKLLSHYCASKAAVLLMTQSAALEMAPEIRLNCICPGMIDTHMTRYEYDVEQELTGESPESIERRWVSGIPMGRYQTPEDIAGLAAFLCSEDASEMTGQGINVTGGMLMS